MDDKKTETTDYADRLSPRSLNAVSFKNWPALPIPKPALPSLLPRLCSPCWLPTTSRRWLY